MMSVLCNTNWLPEFGKPFCRTAGSPKQRASFKTCVKPCHHIPCKHTIVFHRFSSYHLINFGFGFAAVVPWPGHGPLSDATAQPKAPGVRLSLWKRDEPRWQAENGYVGMMIGFVTCIYMTHTTCTWVWGKNIRSTTPNMVDDKPKHGWNYFFWSKVLRLKLAGGPGLFFELLGGGNMPKKASLKKHDSDEDSVKCIWPEPSTSIRLFLGFIHWVWLISESYLVMCVDTGCRFQFNLPYPILSFNNCPQELRLLAWMSSLARTPIRGVHPPIHPPRQDLPGLQQNLRRRPCQASRLHAKCFSGCPRVT